MNDTGPEAVPPEDSSSRDERILDRFSPAPEPPLKIRPSSRYQLRIESIVSSTDRMKQLCTLRLLDRYSPDSVWMSYTGSTPRLSMLAISSRFTSRAGIPGRSNEASSL